VERFKIALSYHNEDQENEKEETENDEKVRFYQNINE